MNVKQEHKLKVHFAGAEQIRQLDALRVARCRHVLYTAFPFLEAQLLKNTKSPIPYDAGAGSVIPDTREFTVIQDSGLFTLMFGAMKGQKDAAFMDRWYEALVEFTRTRAPEVIVVEVDCQKVLGVQQAWQYRKRLRADLPGQRQINVFHLEDGQAGLDALIDFSDYLAISVPELKWAGKRDYVERIAYYIKNKKPEIDIHLLGCTEERLLTRLHWCTSSDSTGWLGGVRYGFIDTKKIEALDENQVRSIVADVQEFDALLNEHGRSPKMRAWLTVLVFNAMYLRQKYRAWCGEQN